MSLDLRISGLSKTYPNGVRALQDVNLTIPTGMFGLLGPNGAGKSTLMRTIATLQEADAGSITLGAIDVLRQKDDVRRVLGYLPTRCANKSSARFRAACASASVSRRRCSAIRS
jgi:ABC-2 type transport system ATP-binding protein